MCCVWCACLCGCVHVLYVCACAHMHVHVVCVHVCVTVCVPAYAQIIYFNNLLCIYFIKNATLYTPYLALYGY